MILAYFLDKIRGFKKWYSISDIEYYLSLSIDHKDLEHREQQLRYRGYRI